MEDNNFNHGFNPEQNEIIKKPRKKISPLMTVFLCVFCLLAASFSTWAVALKILRGDNYGSPIDTINVTQNTENASGNSSDDVIKNDESSSDDSNKSSKQSLFTISDEKGTVKTASQIYSENVDSVVGITANGTTTNIFGQTTKTASSGTGFVIKEDGYILTNCHVIEGATSFTVTFRDGTQYAAEVVGYENEISDIAVMKIEATGLKAVKLGSSSSMLVGEDISIIGNPLGELTFSLSCGVVSALNRAINTDGTPITMFQIDAAINAGNSGGPAFDSSGNVVGIVTAKYASSSIEGLGFCIPIDNAVSIAADIIEYGFVRGRASLGIDGDDAYDVYSYYYRYYGNRVSKMTDLLSEGVYVNAVASDSPAASSGIKKGDYITAVNGLAVADCAALKTILSSLSPGDEVSITIYRDGVYEDVKLTLTEYIPSAFSSSGSGSGISI